MSRRPGKEGALDWIAGGVLQPKRSNALATVGPQATTTGHAHRLYVARTTLLHGTLDAPSRRFCAPHRRAQAAVLALRSHLPEQRAAVTP